MRIGFFADMYQPHTSGVTNHLSLYKRHFESHGHEVFVFTFGDTSYADAETGVVRSPGLAWGDTGWQLAGGYSRQARGLVATLDVAHVHHPFESGRFAAPLVREAHIPLVFTNHTRYDLYSDVYAALVPREARYEFIRRSLRGFTRQCDLVVAPSAGIAQWLADFTGVDGARIIPNGVDVEAFAHPEAPVPRAELGFSADDVVFASVGRLGFEKRTTELAEEFALATRDAPRARLLVIGDGPARSETERVLTAAGVRDRTRFVGMVPYARVAAYEAAADAFVTASVSEAHPLVVIEAMAAGLPVVGIASPGVGDTVTSRADGLLAPSTAPGELADRIARVANDDELRGQLRAQAVRTAQRYCLESTADVLLAAYSELAAARRSATHA